MSIKLHTYNIYNNILSKFYSFLILEHFKYYENLA